MRVRMCVFAFLVISMQSHEMASGAGQNTGAGAPNPAVSLKCKILGAPGDPADMTWILELRNANSTVVRKTECIAGDSIRFKDLIPGIYRVCLRGEQNRSGCQSIDLMPTPELKTQEFSREFRVPASSVSEYSNLQVSVQTLAVPPKALAEFKNSFKAQLSGKPEAELNHLKRAIEIYPDYVDAWNSLGAHQYKAGNYQESIRSFTRVTELAPNFYPGWVNLAGTLLASERFKESIDAGRIALGLRPDEVVAQSQMGMCYYYLRDYKSAKKHFTRVLDLDPAFFTSPQLYLVPIAMSEDSVEEAAGYMRSYLEYHPNSTEAPRVRRMLQGLMERILKSEAPAQK